MFKWWKDLIFGKNSEICDICGKRAQRSKAGALVHYSSTSIYVHSEHIIKSKKFRDVLNSEWYKNVSKSIKEKGSYTMSHQEEAMMCRDGIEGVSSSTEKRDDSSNLLGALCIGAMLSD